jgi:excisionase family DNA binding protein
MANESFGIEPHYTTAHVAAVLSVNPETVRRLAARGLLRFVRVGAELRFPESGIRDYLNRQTGHPA